MICPKPKIPDRKRLSPLPERDDELDNNIDDPINIELTSNSYDSIDSKSEEVENRSCGNEEENDVTTKLFLDPCPIAFRAELSEIMESIGDALELVLDESESSSRLLFLGVMNDEDSSSSNMVRPKRVVYHSDEPREYKKARSVTIDGTSNIQSIAWLPPSCVPQVCSYSLNSLVSLRIRDESPALLSNCDDDNDDLDRQLGEELGEKYRGEGEETPVPLLTPPGSPLTVEWEGMATTLCEWPSNLIVDSAMQAVNELRPMSPTSLENLERDEHDRIVAFTGGYENEFMTTTTLCNNTTLLSPALKIVYA
jgi:hypothetical protein